MIGGIYNRFDLETCYYFGRQNNIGNYGEVLMVNNYTTELEKNLVDNTYDLNILNNNKKMELKSDTYRIGNCFSFKDHCSPNFFMEVISNDNKMNPGGPFQAFEHGVDVFGYLFLPDNVWFAFDLSTLMIRLNKLILKYKWGLKRIKNFGYYTEGYAMPRKLFSDIYTKHTLGEPCALFK